VAQSIGQLKDALAARRLEVDNQIPDSLPALHVDKPKIDRLFDLLLRDEIAMLPAGGRVTFTAELRGQEVAIALADNGPALPQEALRVVLDPFVVTRGTPSEYGINLMACYFIVHHHGGRIEAENLPGGGNRITIHLPLQPEKTEEKTEEVDFLKKAMLNETLWEKLLATG
jgi:signal transduction histidine kinase